MPTAVWVHVVWMIAAVAVGTGSGYLGLLRATLKGGRSFLPGRYTLRSHQWTGIAYYAMLYAGIVYAVVMAEEILKIEATGLWAWHKGLGITIGVLYLPAMLLGLQMLREPPGSRRARPIVHMILNFSACTLVGVQIALAIYAVYGVK